MNSHDVNTLLTMLILGFPLAYVFGGPYLWRGFVIIAWLWLLATWPIVGLAVSAVWLLWKPLKWLAIGLFVGEGLKLSGVFGALSRRPPRYSRRSPQNELARLHALEDDERRITEQRRRDFEWHRAAPHGRRPGEWDDTIDVG